MIRSARYFYYALVLVFKVVCGGIGIVLLIPSPDVNHKKKE
ncbi:DUF3265 domain-containing protein [Vibrio fluvialis]|nr:DUF3265 domain-containing protein [Vibrio fluvialis]